MPTIEDVAKKAGVSRSTVSRVINNHPHVKPEVREHVWKIIRELNYQPHAVARSLAKRHTNVIGLIIPQAVTVIFTDPFFPTVIRGISDACNSYGYYLMLALFSSSQEQTGLYNRFICSGHLDGVIISSTVVDDPLIPRLLEDKVPFVLIGRYPDDPRVNYVDADNIAGAQMAVDYLLRLGHRRVATITGPLRYIAARDRYEGYKQALQKRGLPVDERLVAESDFSESGGYQAMKELLRWEPTAVFVASDAMAVGAMRAIREAGLRIPEDISVIGFDDHEIASYTTPPLTTVRQPIYRLGSTAAATLIDIVEGRVEAPQHLVLPTELILRQTCAPLQQEKNFVYTAAESRR
ncbi:MAG: LacI family DNA-binding transcriptional regulator [Anaerolineae bacterium]|nr:LacI family transcriptional regulator [Anaerolineae bacterium]MDW8102051.1 LacI family DNA-binding transcriptional regulator [Anaerolineae bacterium]